jgi:hypothetical protein
MRRAYLGVSADGSKDGIIIGIPEIQTSWIEALIFRGDAGQVAECTAMNIVHADDMCSRP